MKEDLSFAIQLRSYTRPIRLGPVDLPIKWGDCLIVETARGIESGTVVSTAYDLCQVRRSKTALVLRKVLRVATEEDKAHVLELEQLERRYYLQCIEKMREWYPTIIIKACELLFDQRRVYVYFIYNKDKKEKRNFKIANMVDILSRELNCRVEVKELGVRGVAKQMGAVGNCGCVLCCSSWLKENKSITARMAKDQGLVINPKNLCGVCGKLKCCLRYERQNYIDGSFVSDGISNEADDIIETEAAGS